MIGKLIVIEGTDGSGKATQTKLLVEKLQQQGHSVKIFDFPRYNQRSAIFVEDYLNGNFGTAQEVGPYRGSVFYALDRYVASSEIKEALAQGNIVICNRYTTSSMGHQTGKIKDPEERTKFLDWLQHLEYQIFQIPRPDQVIFLFVPPEIGQELVDQKGHRDYVGGEKKDIHEADLQHLHDASQAYLEVSQKYGWEFIDCTKNNRLMSIPEIHQLIYQKIESTL